MTEALEGSNERPEEQVPALELAQRARDLAAIAFADCERLLRKAEFERSRAIHAALSSHLAEGLVDGGTCPVCGASVSGRPAPAPEDLEPSAKGLRGAREAWARAREALDAAGEAVVRAHRGWLDA